MFICCIFNKSPLTFRKEVHEDASDLNELDNFNSLEELADKLILDRLPHGFVSQFTEESAVFSLIRIPKDLAAKIKRPPELAACLIIEVRLLPFLVCPDVRLYEF